MSRTACAFLGDQKLEAFSNSMEISRSVLSPWLSGRSIPKLSKVLLLIDPSQRLLSEFVDKCVGVESGPSLQQIHKKKTAQKLLQFKFPIVGAVLAALELNGYVSVPKRPEGFLARTLGISIAEEKLLLQKTVDSDLIEFRND